MNQMLMGVVIILGLGSYYLYQENNTLKANIVIKDAEDGE